MKSLKMSLLALTLLVFAASCGNTNADKSAVDTSANKTTEVTVPASIAPKDTMTAPPANPPATTAPATGK